MSRNNIDERHIANSLNKEVENIVFQTLKGNTVSDDIINKAIPCGAMSFRKAISEFTSLYPQLSQTLESLGGLNNSKDLAFIHNNSKIYIEIKKTKKKINSEVINKTPWIYYCEFLQGQLKAKNFQNFLGDYSARKILKKYYNDDILQLMVDKNIEGEITFNDYLKVIYGVVGDKIKEKTLTDTTILPGARNLLKYLLEHKRSMVKQWKEFQNNYIQKHRLNDTEFMTAIKERLANKDIWICIGKNDIYIVEGPQCISLKFKDVKIGRTTSVLLYDLELKKPSSNQTYTVTIEFRLHWKNIGQGAGNPNFMLK